MVNIKVNFYQKKATFKRGNHSVEWLKRFYAVFVDLLYYSKFKNCPRDSAISDPWHAWKLYMNRHITEISLIKF